ASGTVEVIERAFSVQLAYFDFAGGRVIAPVNEPSVPVGYANVVHAIYGLDTVPRLHPNLSRSPSRPSVGSGPGGGYTPSELRSAYDFGPLLASANGSGQTVALVEFDSFQPSDVAQYAAQFGLGATAVSSVVVDGGPPGIGDGALEA